MKFNSQEKYLQEKRNPISTPLLNSCNKEKISAQVSDYLNQFKKLNDSDNQDALKLFQAKIYSAIEAYAEITDFLKKHQHIWNKRTEELCILRDMIQKKIRSEDERSEK